MRPETRTRTKKADPFGAVGVVGLGYVGLPLFIAFSRRMRAVGVDTNRGRVNALKRGASGVPAIRPKELKDAFAHGSSITIDFAPLRRCDAVILCVPTPVGHGNVPDLSAVRSAAQSVARTLHRGQLIVLESTTFPGTTREVVLPILEGSGLRLAKDFHLAYSPERIDPGNRKFDVVNTPKLVGGLDEESAERARALYAMAIKAPVIVVSSAEVAEAAKILENVFRNVNIALINELSLAFDRMGINTWEVIEAASSKPFGFMPFYPGPGVGGHCIPLDPLYLSYRAKQFGFTPRFIELGHHVNEYMSTHAVNLAESAARRLGHDSLRGVRVVLCGLAYKRDVPDTRESPSLLILDELLSRGARVRVHDPRARAPERFRVRVPQVKNLGAALRWGEVAVFAVDHSAYKSYGIRRVLKDLGIGCVVDCRHLFPKVSDRVVGIGYGRP